MPGNPPSRYPTAVNSAFSLGVPKNSVVVVSRYFLHFYMADVTFPDQDGVELSGVGLLTAQDWARFIFSAFEGDDEVELAGARFEIADELGRVVAVVPIGNG